MKYLRFQVNEEIKEGLLVDKEKIQEIEGDFYKKFILTDYTYNLSEVTLLPPCLPSKVICVGLNYVDHAKEVNMPLPDEPVIFLKPKSTVIGPNMKVIYPPISNQLDYEAELAIVIKQQAKNITVEEAKEYILGYTCGNDITARDLQRKDGQWTRAKSFDTFCPLGPWIVSELDTSSLSIELRLNGKLKQSSSTKEMIFSPSQLVSFISQVMTLEPGDVIMTGTPPGIDSMNEGDLVEVTIENIGTLRNTVAKP